MGSKEELQQTMSPATLKKRKRDKHDQSPANGGHKHSKRPRSKSKSVHVENVEKESSQLVLQNGGSTVSRQGGDVQIASTSVAWKVSQPMGGRISDIDPIFSQDEKYLIFIYETSIQVYSTEDSLLVRNIQLVRKQKSTSSKQRLARRIVAAVPSLTDPNVIWAADSTHAIWQVNWTTGATDRLVASRPATILCMAAVMVPFGKGKAHGPQEVLVTAEADSKTPGCVFAAYSTSSCPERGARKHLYKYPAGQIHILRTTAQGLALVGAGHKSVVLATVQEGPKAESFDDLALDFYSFNAPDEVCSLDAKMAPTEDKKKPKIIDLALGCARGSIYVYYDVLSSIQPVAGSSKTKLKARHFHWHPRAVHSVKWSLDGEYFISGGAENTLVLWQVDTGRKEFLPHLQASIENIVVSPQGASYAIVLDDNSAMVISTSEMRPTAYISGLQSLALRHARRKDASVHRVWSPADEVSHPLTAAVNPADPARLYLCVGNGQAASAADGVSPPSTSLLQVFDMTSFQSLAKQPLARTHPTETNVTPKGFPVTEPFVQHLAFSHDGSWMASVDEWQPPPRDMDSLAEGAHALEVMCQERKEVHLKFWKVGREANSLELVTRLDEAHFTTRPESILDVAASPKTTLFASIGGDSNVRIWAPHMQQSSRTPSAAAAVVAKRAAPIEEASAAIWSCVKVIPLAANTRFEHDAEQAPDETSSPSSTPSPPSGATNIISGALAFSDDGSTLFVASGLPDEVSVYVIDAASWEVRTRLDGLARGEVRHLRVLGSCLIVLSGILAVYDVVEDRLRYGVNFDYSPPEALQMTHLAVDRASKTFALSVPIFEKPSEPRFAKGTGSELAVFTLDDSNPVLNKKMPNLVTALLSVHGPESGFVVVDSAAQVSAVIRATATNPLAQPLSELRLDDVEGGGDVVDASAGVGLDVAMLDDDDDDGGASEDELPSGVDRMDEDDEDLETHDAIIVPEKLTAIFDAAPAFALPPIEELFYRVSSLISPNPPLASAAAAA